MFRELKRVFVYSGSREVLVECRQCGSKLEHDAGLCPHCGSSELARYEL